MRMMFLFYNQNQTKMKFDFQKLAVYQKAKFFHVSCKALIEQKNFHRNVNDQLFRASFSVPLNIAEGSGKFSKRDRKNYFTIARASVFECVAVVDILNDDDLITNEEYESIALLADELSRILYAMIKNLTV